MYCKSILFCCLLVLINVILFIVSKQLFIVIKQFIYIFSALLCPSLFDILNNLSIMIYILDSRLYPSNVVILRYCYLVYQDIVILFIKILLLLYYIYRCSLLIIISQNYTTFLSICLTFLSICLTFYIINMILFISLI